MKNSFSLIETSIVLVVIGLLAATVTIANRVVKSAQSSAIIRDISYYRAAIDSFKILYGSFPGDFANAYSLWGSLSGANSCTNNVVTTTASGCNGNGNGYIDSSYTEDMRSWQHLELAGFIPGSYLGTAPSSSPVIGANVPAGAITGSAYHLDGFTIYSNTGSGLRLMNVNSVNNGIISPIIAYMIDNKIDDGLASNGNIYTSVGANYSTGYCVSQNGSTYSYIMSDKNSSCRMWFYLK